MSNRYNALENLTTLQDLIKRDPESYRDEFLEQYRHYENTIRLFQLQPDLDSTHLIEVVHFVSQVSHCYPNDTISLATSIQDTLQQNGQLLDAQLRLALCKCLVILRNKQLADPLAVLRLFFDLARCRDKVLRKYVYDSTVSYVKYVCMKKKSPKINSLMQAYVFSKLNEAHAVAARLALLICIELYRRRVWQDAKTANAIGRACFSRVTKIFVTACKFFLGKDMFDENGAQDDSSSDDDDESSSSNNRKNQKTMKEIMVGFRVGKKTRKRCKQLAKAKEQVKKVESKQKSKQNKLKHLDFSAFYYLYDPQDFAERLFSKLEKSTDRFEVKLMLMALIARIIGVHKLQLLNFYPFLQKYTQTHQRDVTKILLFAAQASHDLVPPDTIQILLKTVVNNFVSDRNSAEAITVGLNTVRQIAEKCPLSVDEDLLSDLVAYKSYKNKNVSMAAKGLIQAFREINPAMLKKRDRGKPTEAMKERSRDLVTHFSQSCAATFVHGAECLATTISQPDENNQIDADSHDISKENVDNSDDESSDGLDDDEENGETSGGRNSGESDSESESDSKIEEAAENDESIADPVFANNNDDSDVVSQIRRVTFAQTISETRIFTQKDFKLIAAHQTRKQLAPMKGKKRKLEEEQRLADIDSNRVNLDQSEDEEEDDDDNKSELPRLRDIEHLHKRPKQDKTARMESVRAGREGREKFGRRKKKGSHVGRTNKNLAKRKAFSMVKQKQTRKTKKRSFREKQLALRRYLLNQKKMH